MRKRMQTRRVSPRCVFYWRCIYVKQANTRMLVESAVMIAIATVLSMLKFDLPFGGGVTIVSMLPLVMGRRDGFFLQRHPAHTGS